jgi:hypothetical protein
VACGQLLGEQMRHTEDRARLVRCVSGLGTLVCSTKHASDELVDGLRIALEERVIHVTADDGVDAWARRLFAATGDERTVIGDPHATYFGAELKGGELTPGDGARIGTIDFDTWFATHRRGVRR